MKEMRTIRERLIAALETAGEKKVDCPSRRYIKMTRSVYGQGGYYFIGKAGSLRWGESYSHSTPCADGFKKRLLAFAVTLAIAVIGWAPAQAAADLVPADACPLVGMVANLPPFDILNVRDRPAGEPIDVLQDGQHFYLCRNDSLPWVGIFYHPQGKPCERLPIEQMRTYQGPCRYGWVHSRFVGGGW